MDIVRWIAKSTRHWDGGFRGKEAISKKKRGNTQVFVEEYLDNIIACPSKHAEGKFGYACSDSR